MELSEASREPVSVRWRTADRTATSGPDYSAAEGTLTIPSGDRSGRIRVWLQRDRLDEDDETFAIEFRRARGAVLATDEAIGTIEDDDDEPTVSIEGARAVEGDGRIGFPVRLDAASGRTVAVEYATKEVSATKDVDYQVASGTLSLAPGTTTETIWVTVVDDAVEEEDETLEVVLTELRNAAPGELIGTGVIEDDDAAPAIPVVPALLVRDARAREADGRLGFLVELDGESERTVAVKYRTQQISATPGVDYEEAAGTLDIPAGSSGETIWVTVLDDSLDEDDEILELLVQLDGETPAALVATGTIEDDDAPPVLRVDDARASESDAAIGFPVRLSAASGRPVTVEYATRALSATSDVDYQAVSGTLTLEPGSTGETVWVTLLDDLLDEDEERLELSVTRAGDEVSEEPVATGTIVDDDAPPVLRVEDVRASEADGRIGFPVRLSAASGRTITVDYATQTLSATPGLDYQAVSGTLTLPPGSTGETIWVTLLDDRIREDDETLEMVLTGPRNAAPGNLVATGTIEDDDLPPTIRVQDTRALESAGHIGFSVRLDAVSAQTVTVRYATRAVSASSGVDFVPRSGTLTVPPGTTERKIWVEIPDDRLDEADETFELVLSEPRNAVPGDLVATGVIEDDDAEPALLIGDARAVEAEGRIGFFVWLGADSGRTVTVDYATRAGSATEGVDYHATSGTLAITPGSSGDTIWVTVVNDRLHEHSETLEMVLSDPRFAVRGDLLATGTIRDDDAEPDIRVADASVREDAGRLEFVVTLEAVAGRELNWRFATWDGSAVAGEDYEARTGTVVFDAGETRKTIPVTILDDTIDEVEEDFHIRLTNPRPSGLGPVDATGVILDDDDNAIVADAWISRFGRTVATQVVNAVESRFAGMGGPGSRFLLGMDPFSMFGPAGARGSQRWESQWRETSSGGSESVRLGLHPGRILAGTSFVYQTEEDEPSGGGLDGRWTAWGRGSFLEFDGLDPAVGVSGEVFNMTAGFDYETGPVIAGLALAGSVGTGDYHVASTEIQSERMGEIWSILGSVHPYVHVSLAEWLRVWGLGGIGSGTLRISGSEQDADLHMRMWAFGGRSDLQVPGLNGFRFALKSDVFWVEMDSDATDTRRGSTAEARRLRLMLESTFRVVSFWGGDFSPLLEAGVRDDAGDAETGRGLEVASGFRYHHRDRGLFVEATARSLVSHEDESYREWGVGGTVRLDPGPDYEGLAIQINSSRGAAASTVQRLWSDPGAVTYYPGMTQGRHEAEVGLRVPGAPGRGDGDPLQRVRVLAVRGEQCPGGQPRAAGFPLDVEPPGGPEPVRIPGAVVRGGPARAPASGAVDAPGAGRGEQIDPKQGLDSFAPAVPAGTAAPTVLAACPRRLGSPSVRVCAVVPVDRQRNHRKDRELDLATQRRIVPDDPPKCWRRGRGRGIEGGAGTQNANDAQIGQLLGRPIRPLER